MLKTLPVTSPSPFQCRSAMCLFINWDWAVTYKIPKATTSQNSEPPESNAKPLWLLINTKSSEASESSDPLESGEPKDLIFLISSQIYAEFSGTFAWGNLSLLLHTYSHIHSALTVHVARCKKERICLLDTACSQSCCDIFIPIPIMLSKSYGVFSTAGDLFFKCFNVLSKYPRYINFSRGWCLRRGGGSCTSLFLGLR